MAQAVNRHIQAALAEVHAFNLGSGLLLGGQDQDPLRTPQERHAAAPAAGRGPAPTRQELAQHWDGTPSAEFLDLANGAIRGFSERFRAANLRTVPVPGTKQRSGSAYRDCKPLQSLFSRSLSLTQKIIALRDLARTTQETLAVQRRRGPKGSIGSAIREKRGKGVASRKSGRFGTSATGVPKRSPHIRVPARGLRRSPPPSAGAAVAIGVQSSVIPTFDGDA